MWSELEEWKVRAEIGIENRCKTIFVCPSMYCNLIFKFYSADTFCPLLSEVLAQSQQASTRHILPHVCLEERKLQRKRPREDSNLQWTCLSSMCCPRGANSSQRRRLIQLATGSLWHETLRWHIPFDASPVSRTSLQVFSKRTPSFGSFFMGKHLGRHPSLALTILQCDLTWVWDGLINHIYNIIVPDICRDEVFLYQICIASLRRFVVLQSGIQAVSKITNHPPFPEYV